MKYLLAAACAAALAVWPRLAAGDHLTLDEALARARQRAPALLDAQATIAEARGRLTGASVYLRDNPELDTTLGGRSVETGTLLEGSMVVRQAFELGGQRGARMAAASAAVAHATATAADVRRRLLRDVAVTFFQALHAQERQRVAERGAALAADLVQIAQRRHQAGDIGVLDVNLATTNLARARSEVEAQAAITAAVLGSLRNALGMEASEPLDLAGDLREQRPFSLPELLARALQRPDLQALAAAAEEARADARLGRAAQWPNVGLGVVYERDDGRDVALGSLSVTLPVFERGQGARAQAEARERRAALALEMDRRAVSVEVHTAFLVYQHRKEAVAQVAQGLPDVEKNEALARSSYAAGQIGLGELLILKRELLDLQRQYLAYLLDAAIAAVDIEAAAGVSQ